ncbi:MAG: hypothetical protein GOVbin212_51 [Prokaryotic dsDNA virus sp.]|nr:MAG: hypothetical protein GOVbin212_51 [Prokaryotic dsDNA virus sp.]|tara:strand:- start:23069 stop:23629 length:561 start_codon:yes stop_codon:yes gene_type:complete
MALSSRWNKYASSKLSAGLGSLSIKPMKTSISFDALKAAKWLESEDYRKTKASGVGEQVVSMSKALIKGGHVEPELEKETIKERKRRPYPPSIGGIKPLYDTGELHNSLRFDKSESAIYGVWYAFGHFKGVNVDWKGRETARRNPVEQAFKKWKKVGSLADAYFTPKIIKPILLEFKRKFSRRLAK